jgi:hypothetical protein
MKKIVVLTAVLLTGCATVVPVRAKFPDAPELLMQKCPALTKLNDDPTLSDVAKTVANNYTSYHECAVLVNGWQDWYQIQKNIYENAGK